MYYSRLHGAEVDCACIFHNMVDEVGDCPRVVVHCGDACAQEYGENEAYCEIDLLHNILLLAFNGVI